jgi:hypothetical protein
MSNGKDVLRRHEKRLNDESQAEHSMTSEQDQLTVEERERQRDAISRARKATPDSDSGPAKNTGRRVSGEPPGGV